MKSVAGWLADAARVVALLALLTLPLFAGYPSSASTGAGMFDARVMAASALALLSGLLACVAWGLGSSEMRRGPGAAAWPLAAFLALSAAATARSVYLHASLLALVQVAGYVALLAVCASLLTDRAWGHRAWAAIALAGALEGVLGLRDWTQTAIFQGDLSWRIFGTMYNPNVLAGYLLAALPAAVVMLALAGRVARDEERPRLALIAAGFGLAIACAALLLTASRAGLLGALVGAAVLVAAAPWRVRGRWLLAAAAALAVLVMVAPPLRARVLSAATQSHSAIFRWYTWRGTASMVAARPLLGFGPGTFEHAFSRHAIAGYTRMAHQTPLQIAAEAGVPALLALLTAVGMMVAPMVRRLRDGGMRGIEIAAGLAALAALGVQNMVDYTWYVPAVGLTLSAVVGLALAAARETEDEAEGPPARRWPAWPLAALLLAALVACGIGLRAQVLAERGRAQMARGGYRTAAGWLRQAAEVDPLDAEILEDLALARATSGREGMTKAVQTRLRAARLNPLKAGNYLALARLYDELGDAQSALEAAREAVRAHPTYPRAYVLLAQLLEQQGRHDEALETYLRLEQVYRSPVGRYQPIEEVTDYSWAYAWLALAKAAEDRGELSRAAEMYARAAKLTGEFARLKRAREEVLRALGTWNEADVREAERLQAEAERGLRRIERAMKGRDAP